MDPAAPKPSTTTNSSLAKVFLPGSEAKEQDWKKHTYTEMLASPTHDVQVMLTQDNRVMLISHDKIVAYAPKTADILLDHVEVIGPKIPGQQQELSVACLIKKPNSQEYDFEVAKLRTNKIEECVHKASAGGVDIPQYLGNQVVAIMFDSGHYVGFDMSLNTATPKQRPDILPFHDENHIYVQKIHKFGANASFCLGQFEGHYYRFYDLQLRKWSTVGFNLPFDIGYIMRAILVGTPNSGHLIIDSGAKILLIKVGMNCEIIQEIPFEDITGKRLPDNHFPIVTYFRIYKGKYLLSIIDSTNLWVLPLVKDAKHPKGKHYNLKGTVEVPEKKTENDDQNTFQFIRWDSNPGHVIVLDKQKLVTVKIDKLVEDFPDFATPIREEDFDVKSDKLEVTKIKPKALKSVAPMKATAESPVMKEFPYPEALEQKQTRSVAFPEEEFGQNSSLAQTNYRSTILKSQHKLTWSAPNPYAEQYEQKPWHAYEEEEAAIITSMEYKRKVQAEARKKKPFQVLGIHHPPKKSYNSLGDQHLAMFFSKPDVMKHLLKQKLVSC